MRLVDLFEDIEQEQDDIPHLFLDMDGVQADFFGAVSSLQGMPRRHASQYHVDSHQVATIEELAVSGQKEVYDFFRTLDPLPGGLQLVSWIRLNKIPYTVLSAPLRGPFSGASIKGKKDWLKKYHPGVHDQAIFTSEKFRHAKSGDTPNVLVDDFGKYLLAWEKAGGIPVKYEEGNTHIVIQQLEEIYKVHLGKGNIYDKEKA